MSAVEPARLSVGIGLTNDCNLACNHCYRPRGAVRSLTLADVRTLLTALPAASVNLGTGENILNPELPAVLDELSRLAVPTSLTSNGLTLLELDEMRLSRLHDVEISIDFADAADMDAFRGSGAFATAVRAIDRCVSLGIRVTVLAVMMRANFDRLVPIEQLAARRCANFRVNVYQPVHDTAPAPTWQEFWLGFGLLFAETQLITCSEPVVAAWLQNGAGRPLGALAPCGCGRTSLRLTPSRELLPCVYWPQPAAMLPDLQELGLRGLLATEAFQESRTLPAACAACPLRARCGGGCAARRALSGDVGAPDPYCPYRGDMPALVNARRGPPLELLHAANVCTTIVRAH